MLYFSGMLIEGVHMENRSKNTIIDNKSDNEQLEAATEWLLQLNQDGIEESIINNFKYWLGQDKKNKEYFKETLQVWQLSALIAPKFVDKIEHLLVESKKS
jgi:ferric-dicitrate binding protein FerR (iron transport regulator)